MNVKLPGTVSVLLYYCCESCENHFDGILIQNQTVRANSANTSLITARILVNMAAVDRNICKSPQ